MRRWLWILCAAVFWGIGLWQWHSLLPLGGQVFLDFGDDSGVTARELAQMEERGREAGEGLPGLAAWSVEREVQVENAGLGRVCDADCMRVYGDREAALSGGLVGGNYGCRSDRETCVISRGLAYTLFGSDEVLGKYVKCRGKAYAVRGIIRDDSRMIVLPADETDGAGVAEATGKAEVLRYLLLDFGGPGQREAGGEAARQLLSAHGLGNPRYLVDGTLGPAAAGFFLLLPVAAVLGRGLWMARREAWPVRVLCVFAAILATALAVWFLGGAGTRFPEELLPSRWSDFDFWTRRWQELVPALRFAGELGRPRWIWLFRCRCAAGAAASLGAVLAVFQIPVRGGRLNKNRVTDCKRNVIDTTL